MEFNSDFFKTLFVDEEIYQLNTELKSTDSDIIKIVNELALNANLATDLTKEVLPTEAKIIPLLLIVETIDEAKKVFLDKILNAVGLNLEKIEIITLNDLQNSSFSEISINKTYQKIISFGVPMAALQLDFLLVPYQVKVIEGIPFLLVEKLFVIENDTNHKRQLWANLQALFNLKK